MYHTKYWVWMLLGCMAGFAAACEPANDAGTRSGVDVSGGESDSAAVGSTDGGTGGGGTGGAVTDGGGTDPASGTDPGGGNQTLCTNGVQDPGEEGVDCGGACPSCTPQYAIDPPDPCYAQFWVEGCDEGNPASACGGQCRVANACSPPESQDKAGLPMGFICPRFMLFSPEMVQAAKDDAARYGWSQDAFVYGIVGHDADVGGVDNNASTCCQCYQLVFEQGEDGTQLDPPPPLIVQSFNTAAGGPNAFDLFMGAGGYGAFNACYDDPNFSNNSTFGQFLYTSFAGIDNTFVFQGQGGVKATQWQDGWTQICRQGGVATPTSVGSDACQSKVAEICDQIEGRTAAVTNTTRTSCKEANDPTHYYHMNWDVRVARVQCPEALTRVTGCRLNEPDLPMPFPDVRTPEQATGAQWKTGYHITTMQDCCKPTCAWMDNVGKMGQPVDGEWGAFYTCDINGVPITK